jgi:hypothetical protein
MLISRQDFEAQCKSANLDNREIRQQISRCVLDEVAGTRFVRRHWCVNGCAPLDMSGEEYQRPVGRCLFGPKGWEVRLVMEWFAE